MNNIDVLKKSHLFDGFTDAELETVVKICHQRDVIAGDYVFDEGAEAASLFIIKSGAVAVNKKPESGDEQHIADLSAGSHFGEMPFIDYDVRAAGVMASENVQLIELRYEELDNLVYGNQTIGMKFFKNLSIALCRRIRHTTNDLASLRELKLKHA